jgi:hypothetical protein
MLMVLLLRISPRQITVPGSGHTGCNQKILKFSFRIFGREAVAPRDSISLQVFAVSGSPPFQPIDITAFESPAPTFFTASGFIVFANLK